MTKTFKTLSTILFITSLLTFTGCSDDDDNTDNTSTEDKTVKEMQTKSMTINFKPMWEDEKLMCSEDNKTKVYHKYTPTHAMVTLRDFRLFISNIYLIDDQGNKEMLKLQGNDFQYQDENGSVVLLDFENNTGNCIDRKNTPAMNMVALGDIADKTYSKIEFTLGVPFHTNHTEYPNVKALNQPGMAWNWQAGRKFTKFESSNDINSTYIFNLHLGSTGCADNDADGKTNNCIQPNRVTVTMDFNPSQDEVIVNYATLLGDVDVTFNKGSAPGCMSKLDDPECATIIPNFGLNFDIKDGECENEGCEGQKLFSINTKE